MYIRKVKRKCNVRGCKCTESYAISLAREVGNSVIICKSCLEKGLTAINESKFVPDPKPNHVAVPPLFFSGPPSDAATDTVEETNTTAEETNATAEETTPPSDAEFVCPHCGQVCKTELGLQKHIAAKHKEQA